MQRASEQTAAENGEQIIGRMVSIPTTQSGALTEDDRKVTIGKDGRFARGRYKYSTRRQSMKEERQSKVILTASAPPECVEQGPRDTLMPKAEKSKP